MRPPLGLDVEITYPDGSTVRWDADGRAEDRPSGISFNTARMDGFKDASCTLARRIDRCYPDAQLFYGFALRGHDGSTAYEGRIGGIQRSLTDTHSMSIQAAGLMANAKDRKFSYVFVDRDFSQWQPPNLSRRAQNATNGRTTGKITASTSSDGLVWEVPTETLPDEENTEVVYTAPEGSEVASIMYRGARTGAFTGFEAPSVFTADSPSFTTSTSTTALTLDDTLRTVTPSVTARALMLRAYLSTGPNTITTAHQQRYSKLGVYGNHGLTTYAITDVNDDPDPEGVYVSDVMRWLISNYCPLLNADGVQDTTYPVGHLVFRDRTFPYDAFLTLNSFHRWGLECWEGGTVNYGPVDLGDYDWELRLDDFGMSLNDQGDSSENVANGIEVTFTDVLTGEQRTLLPDDYTDLQDTNPLNPVNRAGLYRATDFSISSPSTEDMALQIGRIALAEFNQPKGPGTATKQGYIKDRAGNDQPVWKVRAGDRICITDHPDERNHLVFETSYDHSNQTVSISVDDSAPRLDAYLDRYANALQASNLG